jgi:hypothetical protein
MKNLIDDTRRLAYGSLSDQINLLATDYPVEGGELELELAVTGITPGMILSSGLNVWWVKEVSASSNTVYVVPRYEGSFAERLPAGSVVFIKPRVSDWFLFNAVNDVIAQLSSPSYGLYRLGQFEATPVGQFDTIPIPDNTTIDGIVSVAVLEYTGSNRWIELPTRAYRWMPEHQSIKVLRDLWSGLPVRVEYRGPFKKGESLVWDVESQSGLAATMTDLPALGAAATLLRTTESRRNQISVQGDPRRADEVGAGANSSIAREMERQFRQRVNDEYARLIARNPIFMGV